METIAAKWPGSHSTLKLATLTKALSSTEWVVNSYKVSKSDVNA